MAKYDGLLGQPILEVEEPDKDDGITFIFKDNRFMFIKAVDGKIETISIPIICTPVFICHYSKYKFLFLFKT